MIGGLRKKIALGLACCMLLGTIPVNASAAKTAGDVPPVQSDAKNASAVEEAKEGDLPVSYTHLDVYKRQPTADI